MTKHFIFTTTLLLSFLFAGNLSAHYGAYPGGAEEIYVSLGAGMSSPSTENFAYGSTNGSEMVFDTNYTGGIAGEIAMGYVFPTASESFWKNFRFEASVGYSKSSSESRTGVDSMVDTPVINGAFGASFPSFQSSNELDATIDFLDIDLLIKSDIDTDFLGIILTPLLGLNVVRLEQDFEFKSTPTIASQIDGVTMNENLSSMYYGLRAGTILTIDFNDVFSLFGGGGMVFMQANSDFTGNQTISSSNANYNRTGSISETETETASRTFFLVGASLTTDIGRIEIVGKMDKFDYVPYIKNPTSSTGAVTTRAYIVSEEMTVQSVGLNYTFVF